MDRIVIVGAGAMGSFFAARLQRAGYAPLLIARGARLEQVRASGLVLDEAGGPHARPVAVAADASGTGVVDLVLICTKAPDVAAALDALTPAVGPKTALVTVQNGVETPAHVAARFPGRPVLAGRIHGFFEMEGLRVRHVGVEPSLVYGPLEAAGDAVARSLSQVLARAGIAHRVAEDIAAELWEKLVLASAFGGVGAATGLAAGPMRNDGVAWALLAEAMHEVAALAMARGVALDPECAARMLEFVSGFPDDATTSLKRDMEAGRPSEYASLTGAVIRMASASGLEVPAHRRIEAMIRARGLTC